MQPFLNNDKELFRLINLLKVKINLMYVAQKYLLCNFYTINIEKPICKYLYENVSS